MLYGSVTPYLEVTPCGVRYKTESGEYKECSRSLVRCYPDSLTTLFNVSVRNVKGIERVRKTQAYIDGVGSCVIMNNASVSGIPSAVTFPMTVHTQKEEFTALAGAFADTQCGGKFTLTLVVTRTDGEVVAKKIDVTAQIENQPHTHNVDIVIDGLEIPEGEVPDDPDIGGIQVGVDGWTTYEVELDSGGMIRL